MTKKESEIIYIGTSINGKGLFAKCDIKDGEVIFQIKGKLITFVEDDELDSQTKSNTIRFSKTNFINPEGKLSELINHSCNPNSKVYKKNNKLFISAIKSIMKNKEITFDYSTVLASDDIWQMKCNCGEKNCRKIIKMFKNLPLKLRKDYIDHQIVPKYILDIK